MYTHKGAVFIYNWAAHIWKLWPLSLPPSKLCPSLPTLPGILCTQSVCPLWRFAPNFYPPIAFSISLLSNLGSTPSCSAVNALSLYSIFDGSWQGVLWIVGGKKKQKKITHLPLSGEKKNSSITLCRRKKKSEPTSSKLDCTDHVFNSNDSVFTLK